MGLFDGTPLQRPVRCEECERLLADCTCPPVAQASSSTPANEQSPRVRRERRRGKWSTIVAELEGDPASLKQLAKTLKNELSVGGGMTDGQIVLQGDHRDAVVEKLKAIGYRAKAAGG